VFWISISICAILVRMRGWKADQYVTRIRRIAAE